MTGVLGVLVWEDVDGERPGRKSDQGEHMLRPHGRLHEGDRETIADDPQEVDAILAS
jgi:hypothetical protein